MNEDTRPVVLWTCDVPGWAYHNRIVRLSAALPQYRHITWYFGSRMDKRQQQEIIDGADIIVCQGVKALRLVKMKSLTFGDGCKPEAVLAKRFDNVVGRLDSMRVDYQGEYYDIWTGEKVQK